MTLSEKLLEEMRVIVEDIEGLEFAAVFGSLSAKGGTYHDIDIAVKASGGDKYLALCRAVERLSKVLSVREEQIDIVDLDRADLELKKEVLVEGLILLDRTGYKGRLIEEINAKYAEYDELQKISIEEWIKSDDPSSVNTSIVKRRIEFAKREAQFLRENAFNRSVEDFESSPILQRLVERGFHLILEAMLDVCRHIASAMGWGPALSYSDFIDLCFKNKVIEEKLKERIVKGIRLRSIIIHRYLDVDYRRLYEESVGLEATLKEFERQVLSFIKLLQT